MKNLFKCPLVNETLWLETETRPRRLKNTSRDRLETETSRPRLQLWKYVRYLGLWHVDENSCRLSRTITVSSCIAALQAEWQIRSIRLLVTQPVLFSHHLAVTIRQLYNTFIGLIMRLLDRLQSIINRIPATGGGGWGWGEMTPQYSFCRKSQIT